MALFSVAMFGDYWWMYTIDFPINGLSCFFMLGSNRRFLSNKLCCISCLKCNYKSELSKADKAATNIEIDISNATDTASKNSGYTM